ncbi:fimbria/pilus periplasmic chaperone [Klebsiella variicola subsp. variicola]|nr:fimbria/pilus periplasmic chaperone [Klebsiella variicola subsp. variicola]
MDNGDADATPDTITTPFIITRRSRARVDAKSGQTLRLSSAAAPVWRKIRDTVVAESAGNSTGGGQSENEGQNVLQLAIRSRFKFLRACRTGQPRCGGREVLTLINGSSPRYQ